MSPGYVTCEIREKFALVIIDKPPVNAMDLELSKELSSAFEKLSSNDRIRAVILTAKGKSFMAGAEIKHFPNLNRKTGEAFALSVTALHRQIEEFDWPVIAAINGYALGGGCELIMACDMRVASSKSKFGLPEVTLGLIPGAGGTQRLPRLIPIGRAKRLVLSGEYIDAFEAEKIGLVDQVVEPGKEVEEAINLAGKILKNAPLAIRFAKKAINRGMQMPLYDGLLLEAILFGELLETEDSSEGVKGFFEKRIPEFNGR
jgi:enoyl-CoA hydratase